MKLKAALEKVLSKKELAFAPNAFDVVGKVAVLDVHSKLKKKAKKIAQKLLQLHPYLDSVYLKAPREGKFRTQKLKWLAGKKAEHVSHAEWGCIFHLNFGKVYFSPRLSTERQRVVKQIKKGEKIAVFFAGVGPFAILAAKHASPSKVYAFEWNKIAVENLDENVRGNKVGGKVVSVRGDVAKMVPLLGEKFDRIIMPSPTTAKKYLPLAFKFAKKNATLHYYSFQKQPRGFEKALKELAREAKKAKKRIALLNCRIVTHYAKDSDEIVLDVKVKN
ncbi:MAG: hypothetical protein V1847_00450 [Candidatus Diapherotrites archaeon]